MKEIYATPNSPVSLLRGVSFEMTISLAADGPFGSGEDDPRCQNSVRSTVAELIRLIRNWYSASQCGRLVTLLSLERERERVQSAHTDFKLLQLTCRNIQAIVVKHCNFS